MGLMMKRLLRLLLLNAWVCCSDDCLAQFQPLPELSMSRRIDPVYMDSLANLAKKQNRTLTELPKTPQRDSLRLKTLYYLGRLSIWRNGDRDSAFYYGSELVRQARASRNVIYEIAGKVLLEGYYHLDKSKTQEAIQLNLEILSLLPDISFMNIIKYRTRIKLSKLYGRIKDPISELRLLIDARKHIGYLSLGIDTDLNEYIKAKGYDRHYVTLKSLRTFLIDIEQLLGALYSKEGNMVESEKHYLAADTLLKKYPSKTVQLFIYNAISDFYFTNKLYKQALAYANKAALVSTQSQTKSDNWGIQACEHAIRGQDDLAYQFAQKALKLTPTSSISNKLAYMALYQIAEHRQERKDGEQYYINYLRLNDTRMADQAEVEINFIEDQAVYNELTLDRKLQISKLRSIDINFLYIFLVLIFSLLLLLTYSLRLRKRRVEADLRLANEQKEANARIIQTQESERQRIAADLHDDLGGTLATLHRRFKDLRPHLIEPTINRDLEELQLLMQKSSVDLRRIAHNLMPPEFASLGLRNALETLVRNQPQQPTRFSFGVSGIQRELPLDTELNAYRIVSELVENVNKHARANHGAVQLIYFDVYLSIMVEDDGWGNSDKEFTPAQAGIGIQSSTLRAQYIGATLRWEWSKGGTLVILEIPYPTTTHG